MADFAIVIPAAGQSRRFGGAEKKPFVALGGRPVWLRTAELFWTRPDVFKVYLVISPDDLDEFRSRFGHTLLFANAEIVPGGAERFESVANALAIIGEQAPFVAVHDAVRPLLTQTLIDAVFQTARQTGAAMLALPVADTLKRVAPESNTILETVPRANLWQAQTPQVFRTDWLQAAYSARHTLTQAITDDAQLIEAIGHPVSVVPSTMMNFKLTTHDDLLLAEQIIAAREKKQTNDDDPPRGLRAFDPEAQW